MSVSTTMKATQKIGSNSTENNTNETKISEKTYRTLRTQIRKLSSSKKKIDASLLFVDIIGVQHFTISQYY